MLLDVIRHGVTSSNLGYRFNDSPEEPLAEEARAALAAITFDGSGYDLIYASAMRRAVETAERLGLRGVIVDARLGERGLGVFQGLTAQQCRERHGEAFDRFLAYDAEFCIPDGESRIDHLARVMAWLEAVSKSGAERVLAVTHGGTMDFLYRMGAGHPMHGGDAIFGSENLSRSSFRVEWPAVELLAFNEPLYTLNQPTLSSRP